MSESNTETMPLLLPVRGLVPLHTRDGAYLREDTLRRWLLLNRVAFKVQKCDLVDSGVHPDLLQRLCDFATGEDLRVSLRTECEATPEALDALREAGLLDVYLAPSASGMAHLDTWIAACADAGLPMRLQLTTPPDSDPEIFARRLDAAGVMTMNIAAGAPLIGAGAPGAKEHIQYFNKLGCALADRNTEVNFLGYPADVLDDRLQRHGLNRFRFFRDHQQYNAASYDLGQTLLDAPESKSATALLSMLANETSRLSRIDNFVLRFLLHKHEGWVARLAALNRLVRLWWRVGSLPEAIEGSNDHGNAGSYTAEVADKLSEAELDGFRRRYPEVSAENKPFPPEGTARHRHYDPVDSARQEISEGHEALARDALGVVTNQPHTREFSADDYGSENAHVLDITGAVRWCSLARVEKRSTPLATLSPPFTISATFGGGHAEYAGFGIGSLGRILYPMTGLNHTLVLHVGDDGNYVLLCDGRPVRPAAFEGGYYTPVRIPGRAELRLVLWNIDREITTQAVRLWEGAAETDAAASSVKYSVLIPCTRYARRLQAVLMAIAEQDFDLAQIEVIVAYVPGVDATDDVIESIQAAYPALRIVRAPYAERDAKAKGRMINESVKLTAGEWIVLMDADIVLLPETFSRIDAVSEGAHLIAPDGRKMLDRESTGKLLLGLLSPGKDRDALLDGPGEYRQREAGDVPIGFLQCLPRRYFEEVKYEELGHFEGADWRFAHAIRDKFGPESWLDGLPVLHLDHGGSQWYGTQKHF